MRIYIKKTLRQYWEKHSETKQQLDSWYKIASKSDWKTPHDIKAIYAKASASTHKFLSVFLHSFSFILR